MSDTYRAKKPEWSEASWNALGTEPFLVLHEFGAVPLCNSEVDGCTALSHCHTSTWQLERWIFLWKCFVLSIHLGWILVNVCLKKKKHNKPFTSNSSASIYHQALLTSGITGRKMERRHSWIFFFFPPLSFINKRVASLFKPWHFDKQWCFVLPSGEEKCEQNGFRQSEKQLGKEDCCVLFPDQSFTCSIYLDKILSPYLYAKVVLL